MKILAVDLDGTLFYPKGVKRCISKKNVKFLRDFIDAGNKVILCTSRSRQFVEEKLKKEIDRPFDYMVCNTSQIITAEGEIIRNIPAKNEDMSAVVSFLDKKIQPLAYLMTSDEYPCLIKQNSEIGKFLSVFYKLWWRFQFCYREKFVMDNEIFDETLKSGNIYKMMVFYGLGKNNKNLSKELNKIIREEHPNIESSWSLIVNELTPLGCNKGEGLDYYCQYFNINPDDVYVIGDSGNDITMFNKYYEHSYVMSHAYPSVKKYAKTAVSKVFKLRKYVLEGE